MFENNKVNKSLINGVIIGIDVLANIVGIITSIYGNEIIGNIVICIAVTIAIILISIVVINIFKASKGIRLFKTAHLNNDIKVGNAFHSVFHEIRNSSTKVLNQTVTDVESLDDYFKKEEQDICTKAETFFSTLWNKDTCVCIKLLSADDLYNDDYSNWKVYTYARGNSSNNINQMGRTQNDRTPVLITENTDFEIIVNGTVPFYVCENMEKIKEDFLTTYKMVYKNSRENNGEPFSKYYNSTIVLPIRIEIDKIRMKKGNCLGYHLLGFLCVDTLEPFLGEDKQLFRIGTEYAKSIADSLYNQLLNYFIQRFKIKNKTNTNT